jgi:hypothetical protein
MISKQIYGGYTYLMSRARSISCISFKKINASVAVAAYIKRNFVFNNYRNMFPFDGWLPVCVIKMNYTN